MQSSSEFFKQSQYFSLGHLPTEGFHPKTHNLSALSQTDLSQAIQIVQEIDVAAISSLLNHMSDLSALRHQIRATFLRGKKVYLSGCGATGRLALTLEATFRKFYKGTSHENQVQALMAGGDFALVKSVENFEDFPDYGRRHLKDLGFTEGDLLIAITEGGETPYVIGTVWEALEQSKINPWFVYCNPREVLCRTVERSREVIEHPRVQSLCLPVGEMALSGSTRLQAATVQMLAVGAALFTLDRDDSIHALIQKMISEYSRIDLVSFLTPLVVWESQCYQQKEHVIYRTDSYPIAVLTDTTERSPTFTLTPFEKVNETTGPFSWCYLSIPHAKSARDSWRSILSRDPIGLEWPELNGRLGRDAILEFDFGHDALDARSKKLTPHHQRELMFDSHFFLNRFEMQSDEIATPQVRSGLKTSIMTHPLLEQILVKLILNTLSLMVMGRMNRYEGNIMTWVKPSNGKLIDRTLRYAEALIQKRGLRPRSRVDLTELLFELWNQPRSPDQAILMDMLARLG